MKKRQNIIRILVPQRSDWKDQLGELSASHDRITCRGDFTVRLSSEPDRMWAGAFNRVWTNFYGEASKSPAN